MKKLKSGVLAAAAVATVGAAGLVATQAVSAATNHSDNPQSSLVDKIATKFGLNKTDVQQVFDEEHAAREAEHEAKVTARLQSLVDDGTISADQKTLIEAKLKELKTERESDQSSFKNLTPAERKAKMDEKKTALEQWAKDNNIDITKLKGVFMGGPGGPGRGHGPDDADTNSGQASTN